MGSKRETWFRGSLIIEKPTMPMASLLGLESRLQPAELSKQQRALNTSQIAGTADAPPPEGGTPNPELARMHTGKCF